MDGRKKLPIPQSHRTIMTFAGAACIALAALSCWPQNSFAQAMGTATLDPPTAAAIAPPTPAPIAAPVATTIPAPAIIQPPAPAARVETPAPATTTVIPKTTSPLALPSKGLTPIEPKIPVAEAKPLPPSIPEPKPEIAPKPAPEKFVDSLPPETPKSPLLAIEHKTIRPATAEAATTDSNKPAVAATDGAAKPKTSFFPAGVSNALQVAAALAVVLGLVFIAKALARKFVPGAKAGSGKGVIEILARYPLCKNQSLVLVRIGSQIVTLNQGKDQSQSVLVISDAEEVAKIMGQIEGTSPKSIQAGFTKLLANARMDLEDPANEPEVNDFESRSMEPENLDTQLEEMAAAKRQLMELRQQVRSVRDSLPR